MSQMYKDKKEKFDSMVYGYLVKRLTQPLDSTDAYGNGHIDEQGNELSGEEDWSYTKLDKLLLDLRAALGPNLSKIVKDSFDGVDSMALMDSPVEAKSYVANYMPIAKLVEEARYLPDNLRGQSGAPEETVESGMTVEQRISFALTVATALMVCLLKDRQVNPAEIDKEVLPGTEATFGIRSLGDADDIIGYMRTAGLVDGRDITNAGIRLVYRISRILVEKSLVSTSRPGVDNLAGSWMEVSRG